ncbi:MAG: condensation domain-containing protein, partial [Myxococcota bacterium]
MGERVTALLRDYGVTIYTVTPSALASVNPGDFPALRVIMCGGEALTGALAERWGDNPRLVNSYGPTEATVFSTTGDVSATSSQPDIGRPIGNVTVRIMDAAGSQVPVGVVGELCVGGAAVTRGYLGRPGLTADRFRPDPFAREPGGRVYRSGDLARWRRDGRIECLGRIDHQVKIRGHRVELGEIERALVAHPAVREAVVVLKSRGVEEARLVAYLVASTAELDVSKLRDWLGDRLPKYMIPANYVWLDEMPLNTSGKIDRKALPEPSNGRPVLGHDLVEPSNDVETQLVEIWRRVLNVETIGVHDDFFELGGDSIVSIQVVGQARVVGLPLSPRDVFEGRTISAIADRLAKRDASPDAKADAVRELDGMTTPIQRWFFDQRLPRPNHFNQAVVLEAPSDADPDRVARALDAIVDCHDALRLSFEANHSGIRQYVNSEGRWPMARYAADAHGDRDRTLAAAAKVAHRSLDIAKGQMVSAAWVEGDGTHRPRLLLVCHHLAVDVVSWRTLLEDLDRAYAQLRKNGKASLPAVGCSYLGYIKWLNEYAAASEQLTEEAEFWLQQRDTHDIPVDRQGGVGTAGDTASIALSLTQDETTRLLREAPTDYHASPHELMVAALARTLSDWRGDNAAYLSLEGHGRSGPLEELELSRTVGWFTALYPIRIELGINDDWSAVVRATKERMRAVPGDGV